MMPDARRVAVFCPEFFLPYSQTFIWDELRTQSRYCPHVFALGKKNELAFPYPRVHTPGSIQETLRYLATSRCRSFERAFRATRFHLVHAHFGTSAAFAQSYARRHDLPLIVTFHGYDVAILLGRARMLPHRWLYWAKSRSILRESAALLCASEELRDLIIALGAPRSSVHVYRLGVDVDRFFRSDEIRSAPRVTMIGRFVEKKGHVDGIEAFARAVGAEFRATLSIVGSGPLENLYRERISRLGIDSMVTFHGVLHPDQVASLLSRTDVLLAPSHVAANGDRDSGLLVVREAGAAGVPTIGTYHGGIPESIDSGRTGYLVPERDVDQLARRLRELIQQPDLRQQMGEAARIRIRRYFSLTSRVEELATIYDRVISASAARQGASGPLIKRHGHQLP